jgi:hypothetical protein
MSSRCFPCIGMKAHAQDDQGDPRDVGDGGDLAQHDRAGDRGAYRQQRQHEREGGPRQPRHRQLVGHVGDHRRAHPDARPGQQQHRMAERGQRAAQAPRRRRHRGDRHGRPQAVDPAGPRMVRGGRVGDPVAEHDVQHEQHAVGEGEGEPERLPGQPDRRDGGHAPRRQREGGGVTRGPCPGGGQDHGATELDRAHRRQRQPVHREVERRVHQGQHQAQGQQRTPAAPAEFPVRLPRTPPQREHRGRGRHPQPGHPEHVEPGEQQHRQRRPQVVEYGADHEERLRRYPPA